MPYNLDKNGDVKMWTGNGYATVNPNYVSQYEGKGWTTQLPSSSQLNDLYSNPMQPGQSYNTRSGQVENKAPASGSSIFANNQPKAKLYGATAIIGGNAKTNELNPYGGNSYPTDSYGGILTDYQEKINALAMETDPDYNENLEQLGPEEMDKEIL